MSRLQELRTKVKLSQAQVAAKLRTTQQTIARWESGEVDPPVSKIVELAHLYQSTVDSLLGIAKNTSMKPNGQLFQEDGYCDDLVLALPGHPQAFIHPLAGAPSRKLHADIQQAARAAEGELRWIAVATLSQRLLLIRPLALRHIWIRCEGADYPKEDQVPGTAWAANGAPEVDAARLLLLREFVNEYSEPHYREDTEVGRKENERIRTNNAALAERIGSTPEEMAAFMQELEVTYENFDEKLCRTRVFYVDGRITTYSPDEDSLVGLVNMVDSEETDPLLFIRDTNGDGDVFINSRHVSMVDIPLPEYDEARQTVEETLAKEMEQLEEENAKTPLAAPVGRRRGRPRKTVQT